MALEKHVDEQEFTNDELVSVKTTMYLPYYSGSPSYERAYGSVTIDGKEYQYVKRRVLHDTLELLCIPNLAKARLQVVGAEFAKSSADAQSSGPSQKSGTVLKISLPDFFQQERPFAVLLMTSLERVHSIFDTRIYFNIHVEEDERPPQSTQPLIS